MKSTRQLGFKEENSRAQNWLVYRSSGRRCYPSSSIPCGQWYRVIFIGIVSIPRKALWFALPWILSSLCICWFCRCQCPWLHQCCHICWTIANSKDGVFDHDYKSLRGKDRKEWLVCRLHSSTQGPFSRSLWCCVDVPALYDGALAAVWMLGGRWEEEEGVLTA